MTKIRMFMFAALAVIVAFGVCGQPVLAATPHFQVKVVGPSSGQVGEEVSPDVSSKVYELASGVSDSIPPLDGSGFPDWPCFTGGSDPDCSSIPAGGVVVSYPQYTLSLADAVAGDAIWIYWWIEDDNASTKKPLNASITITQGTGAGLTTILQTGDFSLGNNVQGSVIISGAVGVGVGNCATATCVAPVAGRTTMKIDTWVGTGAKVPGTSVFQFK
jgi:hypothetical protein